MTCAITAAGLEAVEVRVGGRRLRAFVGGDGDAVVLVHGLGGGAANWVDVVPLLARGRRVVAVDLPGHGGSAALPRGAGVGRYADAVAGAVEQLDVAPATVVGHSFGGHVALRLAERHPGLARALLLVVSSGVARLPPRTRLFGGLTTTLRPGARVAPLAPRLAEHAWFRRLVFGGLLAADGAAISPAATRGFFAEMHQHADVRNAFRAALGDPIAGAIDLSCPALLLWGAEDAIVPGDHGIALARLLGAPVRFVAGCGHLVPGERPEAVADAVAAVEALA